MARDTSAPSIRCPGCGETVKLPAEICENCGYNFREGKKPAASVSVSQSGMNDYKTRKKVYVLSGAIAIAIIILICIFTLRGPNAAPVAEITQPKATSSTIDVPTRAIGPPIMNPQLPIGLAKDAAGKVNQNQDNVEDTFEQLESEQRSN
jgi:ribosomal protein L32